ncbi:hypothetical protein QE152_g25601 [Popillia japonica]|uniref:Uncharacterized protein n=1 Tax=Popillia japonica TaxID=7064 RepID=A0AAW1K172_POPJA
MKCLAKVRLGADSKRLWKIYQVLVRSHIDLCGVLTPFKQDKTGCLATNSECGTKTGPWTHVFNPSKCTACRSMSLAHQIQDRPFSNQFYD